MARRIEYEIGVDSAKGVSGLKQFSSAAKKELKSVSGELDDASSSAEKVARVLADSAAKMEADMRGAAQAANALGNVLGPELAGRANLDSVVADLRGMGLSFDEIINDADKLAAALKELDRVGRLDIKAEVSGGAERELEKIEGDVKDLDGRKAEVVVEVDSRSLDKLKDSIGDLSGELGALGALATRGGLGAAGIAALGTAAFSLSQNLADASLEAEVLSRLSGDSLENASRLAAVWRTTGADVNDLNDVILQLNGALKDSPELAEQLGINLADGRTGGERFLQVIELMQQGLIDSTTAGKLLGEEGVRQGGRLVAMYDDVAAAIAAVPAAQVFTAEEREKLEEFTAQMTDLKVVAAELSAALAERVLPVLQFLFSTIEKGTALVERLDEVTPEPAQQAGISLGDLFSGPKDVVDQFIRNFKVLIGQGGEAEEAFDWATEPFTGGVFGKKTTDQIIAAADAAEAFAKANKPMSDMPKTWRTVEQAVLRMRQGLEPTADQLQAVVVLTQQYGIEAGEVYNRAAAAIDEHNVSMREVKAAADAAAASIPGLANVFSDLSTDALQAADDAKAFATSIAEAQLELNDMASAFGEMARNEGAIQAAFDIGDAPFEAEKNASNLAVAIEELAAFVREHGPPISDGINDLTKIDFSHGEVDVAPFIAKLEAVKEPLRRQVADAFLTGGEEAARTTALGLIAAITDALGGAISPQDLDTLLFGEGGHTAVIDIAVDQASLAKAQAMLQLLTGLPGADPLWVAQVSLDLQADKLTPEAAQVLIAQQLGEAGLQVPSTMLPPSGSSLTEAKRQADEFYRRNPTIVHSAVGKPPNAADVWRDTQNKLFKLPPLQLRTALTIPGVGGVFNLDAGGTAGGIGGVAGEVGPEFARLPNGRRVLLTEPTYVPPGTRVTSRRRTSSILKTRGLKGYDSGGVVGGRPVTLNVNFNGVGAIGNRYDIMRTFQRAERDAVRLLGTRV